MGEGDGEIERGEECEKRCGNIHTGMSALHCTGQRFIGMYVRALGACS